MSSSRSVTVLGAAFPDVSEWPEMPTHLAAESAVLGHILLDNAIYDKVRGKLGPEDFYLASHQLLFLRMTEMREAEMPVDIVTLSNHLAGKKIGDVREIDEAGGYASLCSLTDGLLRCGAVDEYVLILKEKSNLRRIMQACQVATSQCKEQGRTAAEIVEELGKGLKGIRKKAK